MSVEGVSKFTAQINRLKAEALTKKHLEEAGNFVLSAAVLLAPKNQGYLQNNIYLDVEEDQGTLRATVYTNVEYARYVEFGTGPVGARNHEGTSPNVTPTYTMHAWGIPADQVDAATAAHYGWQLSTYKGKQYYAFPFYGQPAQPFMYPALKDNEDTVRDIIVGGMNYAAEKVTK